MDSKNFLSAVFWFSIAQLVIWFQLNGQFLWPWFKRNDLLVSCLGIPISYFFLLGTRHGVAAFDGLLWPNRFIGFTIGMLVYAFLLNLFFNEAITPKTAISLGLCVVIILIQVLWK